MPYKKPSHRNSTINPACLIPAGPGQVYFLDSTIASIGGSRPARLSVLMDAWVPNIPGFSLSEGRSHDDYATLNSLMLDKQALCRQYRISYCAADWAETGLPFIIVGDHPVKIASALDIVVVVRPPQRPYLRSPLEPALSAFARALASATPKTAMRVFIREIIRWNQQILNRCALPSEALVKKIHPSPAAVTEWGMRLDHPCPVADDTPRR
jgi:hypothetical protein